MKVHTCSECSGSIIAPLCQSCAKSRVEDELNTQRENGEEAAYHLDRLRCAVKEWDLAERLFENIPTRLGKLRLSDAKRMLRQICDETPIVE